MTERLVWAVMLFAGLSVSLVAATGSPAGLSLAPAEIPAETAAAFDRYLRATDARVESELGDPARFLWFDFASETRKRQVLAALGRGEPVLEALATRDSGAPVSIPGGVVHHWAGVVFVPGARVGDAVRLMQDYDRHDEVFAPSISRSQLVSRNDDAFRFTMRFVIRKVITAVLQTDQESRFFAPAPDRAHSRIRATRIVEIDQAGTPREREKTASEDRGYLWRQASYWRFLERDGGTYIQCESLSLSRPLPAAVGWLFGRSAAAIPRDTLSFTLAAARKELLKR